jgi:DNA recombination protein Rad52
MTGLAEAQIKALKGKLKAAHIKTRHENGMEISYIEGWFTIAEANRIFGFDGWSRETLQTSCVWQGRAGGRAACNYVARVRISVHGEGRAIIREGSGFGGGTGETPGEAHEMALKEAETDAMKRAFMTFGNRFGLALYDPEQKGVSRPRGKEQSPAPHWPVSLPGEAASVLCNSPQAFFGELRKVLEALTTIDAVQELWHSNEAALKAIREAHPHLTDQHGAHYTAVFAKLCQKRIKALLSSTAGPSASPANGTAIDKSVLAIGAPRRIRDREHLRYVASQPCLICGRQPTHAHHLAFAQPRARGLKTSDEWAVPLCALHHRELHDRGDERAYWVEIGIDAENTAKELWEGSRLTRAQNIA